MNLVEIWSRKYKLWLAFSIALLLFSLLYISIFYARNGELFYKDTSLTGGTVLTVYEAGDITAIETNLKQKFPDVAVRAISDLTTGKQIAFSIETSADPDALKKELAAEGYNITEANSSTEFTGSVLSQGFYRSLLVALLIAFVLMAIVVFALFKTIIPSLAVIQAAITDTTFPLAVMNILGMRVSTAGIAALLMLIGYSVDTDIMLTNRVLKRKEFPLLKRISDSAKTGLTMTLTSLFAVFSAYFFAISPVLKQVFFILSVGLATDIISTWFGNAGILKWWCDRHKIE